MRSVWDDRWYPLLGTANDTEIAKRLGVTSVTVYFRRSRAGIPAYREPPEQRFWRNVKRGLDAECWEWTGHLNGSGYGWIRWIEGAQMLAHRVSWILARGEIPAGLCICHHCDNRKCINPAHLFLGTTQDNTADMVRKGRHRQNPNPRCGPDHEWTKVKPEHVVELRRRLAAGEVKSWPETAREFGISPNHAKRLAEGTSQRNLAHRLRAATPDGEGRGKP